MEDHRGDLRAGRAAGEIQLQHANLTGAKVNGIGVPDLHFETVALKFEYEGGKLDLQELNADGAELKIGGTGQVVLARPIQNSILNLRVTVLPGAEAPDEIRGLLSLIPRSKKARPDAPVRHRGHVEQAALSLIRRFRRSSARQPRNPVRSAGGSSVPLAPDFR